MTINRQSDYNLRFNDVAGTALLNLREQYPKVYFYFFEKDYWLYFFDISQQYTSDIKCLPIDQNIEIKERKSGEKPYIYLAPEDTILYIGRPSKLLALCKMPLISSRPNPVIFVSIPILSHSLKFNVWKMPINFKAFTSLCFPFMPYKHFLKISVGSFKEIFLHAPLYQSKALKTVLASLAYIFGHFSRVYAVGSFSSDISKGFLDICHSSDIPPGRNNLILFDRAIDLQSLMNVDESYIGILEELGLWDEYENRINKRKLANILGIPRNSVDKLPISTENDPLFAKVKLLTLSEANRTVGFTDFKNTTTENLIQDHTKVLNALYKRLMEEYFLDLVIKIQKNQVDAKKFGRCVPLLDLHDEEDFKRRGMCLSYRMLSSLHYAQNKDATKSIARLLSAKYGITSFSKWNQIDEIAVTNEKIAPPQKIADITKSITFIEALFGLILTDEWKRPKFPYKDSYLSTMNYLPNEKFRWFVGIIGGMTSIELSILKKIAEICRPNDEFIFMSTELLSPHEFMDNVFM